MTALDPAGQWYSLYDVLRQRSQADLRADPIAWTIWIAVAIDGEVRNGGWLQAYWNLDRRGITLADMEAVLDRIGAEAERDDCARLAKRLADHPRQKAWLDEGGPFGAPPGLQRMTNPMDMRFYRATPSVLVRLQEFIWAHREALADALAQAEPYSAFQNRSPLHRAADDGNLAWLHRELARGVPPDIEDDEGETPLMLALARGDGPEALAIIDALIEAGADVTRLNRFGYTLFGLNPSSKAIVERLLANGLAADTQSESGWGLLHEVKDSRIARLLMKAGADPVSPNKNGVTPLSVAIMHYASGGTAAEDKKRLTLVRTLLKAGAFNCANRFGTDVFGSVAQKSYYLKQLIELGLTVVTETDAEGREGNTALHTAAERDRTDVIELLLSVGAPINARTREPDDARKVPAGATPLDVALAAGNKKVVKLLRSRGGLPAAELPATEPTAVELPD